MSGYLGPNVDPDDLPHPYEYDERVPLPRPHDSGNPDPWADLDPQQKEDEDEDPQGRCAEKGCDATFRNRHQWDEYEAQKAGWFLQKSGDRWCPKHTPPWVDEWRARRAAGREAKS